MADETKPDPLGELKKNIEMISPVKKCPKCHQLTLEYDEHTKRIHCGRCGFEVSMVQ